MARHYVSPAALCPFYRMEETTKVYCKGVEEGALSIQSWKKDAKTYKDRYCKGSWARCPVAKMLFEKE
jgi:hypothetical protein